MAVNHADGIVFTSIIFYPVVAGWTAISGGAGWFSILFIVISIGIGYFFIRFGRPLIYYMSDLGNKLTDDERSLVEKFIGVPATGADFYPTILDLAGLELKPEQHVDGLSLKAAMQGKEMPKRDLFWHYPHYGNQGGEPSSIIRSSQWKLIHYYEDGRNELYKISDDIGEQNGCRTGRIGGKRNKVERFC